VTVKFSVPLVYVVPDDTVTSPSTTISSDNEPATTVPSETDDFIVCFVSKNP